MNFPVFDLHCDTALELIDRNKDQTFSLRQNHLHIDLDRAGKLPGYAQCFACFTTPEMERWYGISPRDVFHQEIEAIRRALEQNGDLISPALSPDQIMENHRSGRMSAILTIEGPAGFGYDPAKLEELYKMGFRITTLGWNESNILTGSHATGEGLSDLGREYIKEAQRLGMIVDVSHISDTAFWQLIEMTTAPVIASHSNSRSVWDVSRNVTDDMFLALCRTGGLVGINLYADFLGDHADLNTVCDHIIHLLRLDPEGAHIALGGDLDGCDRLPDGFHGIQDYPKLADTLLSRNVPEQTVERIFWSNALGVFKKCCM